MSEKLLRLLPEQSSVIAGGVGTLYFSLVALSACFTTYTALTLVWTAIRFRRPSEDPRAYPLRRALLLELVWTGVPLVIVMVTFVWGASLFLYAKHLPAGSLQIHAVGKERGEADGN